MIDIQNLNIIFNEGSFYEKQALKNINLHIEDGDFITLIGSNGAGKSTLLNAISGHTYINSGEIHAAGRNITHMKEHKRYKFIARLFQDPFQGTAPSLTIIENLSLAYSRGKRLSLVPAVSKSDREFYVSVLSKLNMGLEDRLDTPVKLLSGGQRQALTLIMATMLKPKLLLLDEHTAALDPKTSVHIMKLTEDIIRKDRITTIMITHNLEDAMKYGNKTLVMNNGKIICTLNQKEKESMTMNDLMKLYGNIGAQISDVNILG